MDTNISTLLKKGIECFENGDFRGSEHIFTEIVESDERSSEAFFYLANIFHRRGEIGKAIKGFKKVLEINPNHTDASIALSVLYNDIGQYDEAKKIFEKANERVKARSASGPNLEDQHINKKFSYKHFELADLYMTYGRLDEALFEYNKAIGLNPGNLEARVKVAKVYAKKGFISKAVDELQKLKNEHPEFADARVALGIIYYGSAKILEAQTEWERVLSMDPRNKEAAMYLNLSKTATETSI